MAKQRSSQFLCSRAVSCIACIPCQLGLQFIVLGFRDVLDDVIVPSSQLCQSPKSVDARELRRIFIQHDALESGCLSARGKFILCGEARSAILMAEQSCKLFHCAFPTAPPQQRLNFSSIFRRITKRPERRAGLWRIPKNEVKASIWSER